MKFPSLLQFGLSARHRSWLFLLLLLTIAVCTASAQIGGSGAIQGRITDPDGAVVPNATVTATNVATGVALTRKATSAGDYLISPLPPGEYSVTVAAEGFSLLKQEHVIVNATRSTGLDVRLKVGSQTQQVLVTSAPPVLDTTDATLGETMPNEEYSSLPLSMSGQQRDPTAFVYLMPGVQGGGRSGTFNGAGSFNGYLDEMYVDGIPLTTISQQGDNRTVSLAISVDAVDQFQVQTSGSPVEFQGMGAQNYVIKSGTNQFHGTVFDFVRNTAFDSWGFFAKAATEKTATGATVPAPKPAEHQNEFGFTLGGPIRKDKMFFFASYDKFHYTYGVNPGLLSIPTMAERAGDFSAYPYPIYDPTTLGACTAANGGTPCTYPFPGNVIPASKISPMAQKMQSFMPQPSNSNLTGNFLTGQPGGADNFEFTGKFDANIGSKQHIAVVSNAGRRGFIGLDYGSATVLPLPYTNGIVVAELTATGILEHTYTITPHLVNQFKYGYVRQWGPAGNPTYGNPNYEASTALGIGNLPLGQSSKDFPGVNFGGGADLPTNWTSYVGYSQNVNTYTAMDNLQWIHGKHSFTFGADFQWLNENESNFDTPSRPLLFNESNITTAGYAKGKVNNGKTGAAYASFLLGAVDSTSLTIQPFSMLGARYKTFSPYAQDDFRVNSKLTLNLGLRWDFYPPYHEVQNRWSFMNPNLVNPATGNHGAIEFVGKGAYSCNCSTPVHYYLGNAAPRLGLAYAVNDKTVIRAAYGIMYSHGGGVGGRLGANNGTGQAGLTANPTFLDSNQGTTPALYLNSNLGNMAFPSYSSTPNINPTVNAGNYIDPNGNAITPAGVSYADPYVASRAPYAENWNVGIQRAITNKMTLEVDYSASQSHFLTSSLQGRGYWTNQLDPKYLVLGGLLKTNPSAVDSKTGQTYLQEAQAMMPGINLPYPNYGGPHATIASMLSPFPQYSGVTDTWGNISNANYNSLQLSLSQRTSHGLSFTVNYTYAKEIDDAGSFRSGYAIPSSALANGRSYKQDRIERALGAGEQPQALNFFGVYDLPFGKGHLGDGSRVVRAVAGGWSLSWIASYHSGTPLPITATGCTAVGASTCMPNYNPAYTGKPRINGGWGHGVTSTNAGTISFIDATAFTVPNSATNYQLGDVARTAPYGLFSPGGYNIDSGLHRKFPIGDRATFVFGAEAFNVTNHVEFGGINTTVGNSNFGTVSRQSNHSRDWQFSGRINF